MGLSIRCLCPSEDPGIKGRLLPTALLRGAASCHDCGNRTGCAIDVGSSPG